jgi:hypothetical protein
MGAPDVAIFCRNGHLLFDGSALSVYAGNVDFDKCPYCDSDEYLTIYDWLYESEMNYEVPEKPIDFVERQVTITQRINRYDVSKVQPNQWRKFPV